MNNNTWAMACHLLGLAGYFGNGIGSIVAPLILWLVKKDELPIVDRHGKEALNFNISVTLYALALVLIMFVTLGVGALIAIPALIVLGLFHLIATIIAAIKANQGEDFRYPLTLRLIK
jgi:uncharacterized Tic20 family protein